MPALTRALQEHVATASARRAGAKRFVTQATVIAVVGLTGMFGSLFMLDRGTDGSVTRQTFQVVVGVEFVILVALVFLLRRRLMNDMRAYEDQFRLSVAQDERLAATSELLRGVLDSSPVALIAMDTDLRVLLWNESAAQLFGWTPEETLGQLNPIAIGVNATESRAMREEIEREGRILSHRTVRARKDGSRAEIVVAGAILRGADGARAGYMLVASDLSERNRLEAQLRQSQKMEAVGQLAGGVAHDFNNVLTVIASYSEILLVNTPPDSKAYEPLNEIKAASDRAAALTRQLLAFSRRQLLQPRILDLNESVTNVSRMLRRVIGEQVKLETRFAPNLGRVCADPGQVEQILMNLAINARDAMPNGGRLVIETANAELDRTFALQHATPMRPGDFVSMVVSDTGEGMTPEVREHVFEPFFTTKDPGKGTGLGLSTVHGIVEQSGGSIFVYSEPGRGTTFKIYLPRVMDDEPRALDPVASTPSRGGTETILLVEDEEAVRKVSRAILANAGYTVIEARNGKEAVGRLTDGSNEIDLVVTDVVMPEMGGPALRREMRDRRIDKPIVYMSGYARATLTSAALSEENAAFIEKPFSAPALLACVRGVLDRA